MDYAKLFSTIDSLESKYIQFWKDICTIESPTSFKEGVDAVAAFCADYARSFGWQAEIHEEAVSGNAVCITMNPDAPGEPICFSGHMDTVHPVGLFGTPAVRTDETYIYGPGVADCKGGIAGSFLAMEALQAVGFTRRPVKLILQSDEEISSVTSDKRTIDFMEKSARGCAVFLNAEPGNGENAVLWRKGLSKYRITVTGEAHHASLCATGGISAIREAACKILQIEEYKDADGITMNCGTIQGGSAINTVPEKCEFCIDVRYATLEEMDEAHEFLPRLAATSFVEGSSSELTLISRRPPMVKADRNFAVLEKMNAVFAAAGLPVREGDSGFGGSDAADLTAREIPCVDEFGVVGQYVHSIRERAEIASMARCAKYLGAVALGL